MLFTVVSIPALNLLLHLLNSQAHSELICGLAHVHLHVFLCWE